MLTAVATLNSKSSTRDCKPAAGKEVLVHDGKTIIVRHGPECFTGCGNPAFVMITGTKAEIDAEIANLGLASDPLPFDVAKLEDRGVIR